MRIAEALLEREVLDGTEVMQLIDGAAAAACWPSPKNSDDTKRQHGDPARWRPRACPGSRKGSVRSRRDPGVSRLPVRH